MISERWIGLLLLDSLQILLVLLDGAGDCNQVLDHLFAEAELVVELGSVLC